MNNQQIATVLRRVGEDVHARYLACNDAAATPSSILLAVANAFAQVAQEIENEDRQHG